jgi:3-phosphoshikimate 1-carboxyvinyltransferase
MKFTFKPVKKIKGELNFKGDKSISHRAVFFSSMAEGLSEIHNISDCEDVKTTIEVFKKLGAEFIKQNDVLLVKGIGRNSFKDPMTNLWCGNSGTTARMLSGVLANQRFITTICGDDSLSNRPMKRIIEPLTLMGAKISHNNFKLPIVFYPAEKMIPINYELKVPSAQVKSSILIAGLFNREKTVIIENFITRDHTERILNLPVEFAFKKKLIFSSSKFYPTNKNYFIPADISSASFFIVLALIAQDSELFIRNVSLNSTRTGFIDVLKQMNANIQTIEKGLSNGEPFGDILVKSSQLINTHINENLIPNIIDEIPILSLAGIFAEGDFQIRNAKELRVKESDRISALCSNYSLVGLYVTEFDDGFKISGKIKNKFAEFITFNDHRIAMTFSVLSMLLEDGGVIDNSDCVKISNPDFFEQYITISTN